MRLSARPSVISVSWILAAGSLALLGLVGILAASFLVLLVYVPIGWALWLKVAPVQVLDAVRGMTGPSVYPLLTFAMGALIAFVPLSAWLSKRKGIGRDRIFYTFVALLVGAWFLTSAFVVPAATAISATQTAEYNQFHNQPCTYYVFTDGTNYYAQNCSTGVIAYGGPTNAGGATGTNATQVTRSTISATTTGTIVFGIGTFTFSGRTNDRGSIYYTLAMKTGVNLVGLSRSGTILKQAGSTSASFIVADSQGASNANDWGISTMTIDGNRANQAGSIVDGNQACIYSNSISRMSLTQLDIQNCYAQGVYDSLNSFSYVANLWISTTGYEGYSVSGVGYSTYQGISITSTGVQAGAGTYHSGMEVSGPSFYDSITGLTSYSNTGAGLACQSDGGTKNLRDITFTGISVFSNSQQGILCGSTTSNTWVLRLHFYGVTATGDNNDEVEFIQVNDTDIHGITTFNPTLSNAEGIHLYDTLGVYVYGAVAYDSQGVHKMQYAFYENAGGSGNYIIGGDVSKGGFTTSAVGIVDNQGLIVLDVKGYNPVASSTATVCASPCTIINNNPYAEVVWMTTLNGGTVSAVTCNGQTYSTSIGVPCSLEPGKAWVVTWATTAPTYAISPGGSG